MTDAVSNSKRVAKNTLYLFLRMIVVMAVGLYTSRVILNTLGVEDYGTYNVVGGIVIFFSFLKQAMTNATYRFFAYALGEEDENKLSNTFAMAINVHVIIAATVLLLSETVGLWFLNTQLVFPEGRLFAANIAYQFSVLAFCINIIQTPYNSSIIAYERMNFFAITSIWEVLLKLGVVYLLVVLSGDPLINYTWLLTAVSLFLYVWYRHYCRKHFMVCIYKKYWDTDIFKSMLKYSGWSVLVNGADIAVAQSTVFFFNIFFGVATNAALGVANQVNSVLTQFLQSFAQAYNPQIIKSYAKGDMDYFHKLLCSTSKLSYLLLFSISMPVLMNIDFILKVWLGLVPGGTGLFVILIVLFSLMDAYAQPQWNAVHATGNLRTHQLMMSGIKVLNIPLTYVVLKHGFDAWTALALKAGLNFVCTIVRSIYMKFLVQLSMSALVKDVVMPIATVTAITLPAPLYLSHIMADGWVKLFVTSFVMILIMAPTTFFLGLNQRERGIMTDGFRKKVKYSIKINNGNFS